MTTRLANIIMVLSLMLAVGCGAEGQLPPSISFTQTPGPEAGLNPIDQANDDDTASGSSDETLEVSDDLGAPDADDDDDAVDAVVGDDAVDAVVGDDDAGDDDSADAGEPAVALRVEFEVACQSETCDFDMHVVNTDIPIPASDADDDGDGEPDPWFHPQADCHYASQHPDWGVAFDAIDDPTLVEQADITGDISAVEYPNPNVSGEMLVGGTAHRGDVNLTVHVYIDGVEVYDDDYALNEKGLWCAAVIDWNTLSVTGCTIGAVGSYLP